MSTKKTDNEMTEILDNTRQKKRYEGKIGGKKDMANRRAAK